MYFLGIDIGTTSISGVILDLEEKRIKNISETDNNSWIDTKNDWERIQDPNIIIRKVKVLLNDLLSRCGNVIGIGITGQMHGILYIDKKGNILSPLYTWQDGRSKLEIKDGLTYVDELKNKAGSNIFPGYGLATHYYNLRNNLVPESTKYISTIADYIVMDLCNEKKPSTDPSNAASLGFFDLGSLEFDVSALKRTGMKSNILPDIVPSATIIGKFRDTYPVVCATGDNQASVLGSTKKIRESININIGTGGQVNIFSPENVEIEGVETRPYFNAGYILLGASLCGGNAFALLEKFFRNTISFFSKNVTGDLYTKMSELDVPEYDINSLKVDTRFDGTRNDPFQSGSIRNISSDNFTPEGLILGFGKGIIEELFDYYESIKNSIDIKPGNLVGSGNGIRKNKVMRLLLEKVFKMPVKLTAYTEEAAVGASITSAVGTGYLEDFFSTDEIIKYQ